MTSPHRCKRPARWLGRGAAAIVLIASTAAGAIGQTTPYETKLYRPPQSSLEKNYGLPSFGLPGSELRRQRTMASPPSMSGASNEDTDQPGSEPLPQSSLASPPSTAGVSAGGAEQPASNLPGFLTSLGSSSQNGDDADSQRGSWNLNATRGNATPPSDGTDEQDTGDDP